MWMWRCGPKASGTEFKTNNGQPESNSQVLINARTGKLASTRGQVFGCANFPELTRNRWVGQRAPGPHESFSLASPYSSVSKPQGDSPLIMGKGIPVPGRAVDA
jgi:hypothetical protein